MNQNEQAHLVRIDIDQWGSDVAQQYGIRSLPSLRLYEGGELVAEGMREVLGRLR